jgi:Icc-related predicted phosphoesterase
MKIAVCSDLHLEFGGITLENPNGADVLVLSGDICVAADLRSRDPYDIMNTAKTDLFFELMNSCSKNFANTVYIMGNHEHYHGDFAKSTDIIRNHLKAYDNIHFLDKECITINDVTFIGGTLWTDMNKEDPLTMHSMSGMMNDYRGVKNSSRMVSFKDEDGKFHERESRFCPEDSVEDHKKMLGYIQSVIEGKHDQKFVVVGHHAPSKLSTHPRYKDAAMMNGAYSSDLSEYIMDHPQIKLWTHGHTHEDFDYMIGSTRIICNPRGYIGYESRADHFKLKVVEV